ncbi:MAG: hypothetical protein WAO52_18970 [Prolixibacteraceae bacterium]
MKETKVRIGTQSLAMIQLESEISNAVALVNGPLAEAICNIGFTPSDEILKDCMNGGRAITQEYYERLTKELSVMSIPSSRTLFENSAREGLKQFHLTRKLIENKCSSNIRKYISFENDLAVYSDEAKKQLNEDFGIYITNPDEIELYNLHLEACEALNNLFKGYRSHVWNQYFEFENGKFKPGIINYDVLLTNIKKAN